MINEDLQLKLQAHLDGELSDRESAGIRDRIAGDSEARALLAELQNTKAALAGQETGVKLPETREFYWSKIQREIERLEPASPPARASFWKTWVLRRLLPVGAVAAITCLVVMREMQPAPDSGQFAEMELNSDKMGAYTFRDQQHEMTTIWFYDKDDSQFTQPASFATVPAE